MALQPLKFDRDRPRRPKAGETWMLAGKARTLVDVHVVGMKYVTVTDHPSGLNRRQVHILTMIPAPQPQAPAAPKPHQLVPNTSGAQRPSMSELDEEFLGEKKG